MNPSGPAAPPPAPTPARLARRDFIRLTALSSLWLAGGAPGAVGDASAEEAATGVPPEFPRHATEAVREIVTVAHTDLDRVRALVEARPALARASWDWGFGDWETPLGAASHMGRRDIAGILLAHGARPSVFSAAMLGQLGVVRAFVEAFPAVRATAGPHGISLLAHAKAGGDEAKPVLDYLESLPALPGDPVPEPLTDAERAGLLGAYAFGAGPDEALTVSERNGMLRIARGAGNRNLFRVEDFAFRPAGAPDVRVTFRVESGRAVALTVNDGPLVVQATRKHGS